MTSSYKKPFVTISKRWDEHCERRFRRRIKAACHEAEIDFDPDADYAECYLRDKKLADWGTRMGFRVPPDESDDTWMHEEYEKAQRK